MSAATETPTARSGVAVIGIACRFPGAEGPDALWRNLRDGVESIRQLTHEELIAAGADPEDLANPAYVPAAAVIDGIGEFDASFFGFTAREAEVMDPQHRLFLECACHALEDAGYDPGRYDGAIGVYAGGTFNSYLTKNLLPTGILDDTSALLQTVLANEQDHITTRVSYKLNLRGPSYTVQCGCSTSLVAIHLACQNLLNFEADMALAGGVAVDVARGRGYVYQEGSVYSPDGHCRAFDARAQGMVFGNGLGIVVLKRLEDAIADRDTIHAVILGSAINNDGSLKVGFTAPSVTGQSRVIVEALADAGVAADTIGFIETHGTGTALGDPIEIEAMTKAFGASTAARQFCAIGSIKTNVGHLDAAAGVSGFIKAVLALRHGAIPPSLNFERPNPKLDLERSPFYVANRLIDWSAGQRPGLPRRAGVSSFGMGGTNAHVVLEEAPSAEAPEPSRRSQLLLLSARSPAALEHASLNLAARLDEQRDLALADVAYTLQVGRAIFANRRMFVCGAADEAIAELRREPSNRAWTHRHDGRNPGVAFLFPGQGAQYVGMARGLRETEPLFRQEMDECFAALGSVGRELRDVIYGSVPDAAERLTQTSLAQPALFAVEYALSRLLMSWGVEPALCIGHSVGEYVAACLSGVFSVEDALKLVARRGQLMQSLPPGAMTAIPIPADNAALGIEPPLSLAAVNSPTQSIVSGPIEAIDRFERRWRERGVECRRLRTSHAFHSVMVEPILDPFAEFVSRIPLQPPTRPFISNVTGKTITPGEATDPGYWARHLRQTVRFAEGLQHLLEQELHLLEVGPGSTLARLAREQARDRDLLAVPTLLDTRAGEAGDAALIEAVGRLWLRGVEIDWSNFHAGERRRRVSLPAYPFDRKSYWIEPNEPDEAERTRRRANEKNPNVGEWLYAPGWKQSAPAALSLGREESGAAGAWLVFRNDDEFSARLIDRLRLTSGGEPVVTVTSGRRFARAGDQDYTIDAASRDDYVALLQALEAADARPRTVVHLWNAKPEAGVFDAPAVEAAQDAGFFSLAWLAQALAVVAPDARVDLKVITAEAHDIQGDEHLRPERYMALAASLVIPQEQASLRCQAIDIRDDRRPIDKRVTELLGECSAGLPDSIVAYRAGRRWVPTCNRLSFPADVASRLRPRDGGVYLITGGLGGVGFALAYGLARINPNARLVLVGRSVLPPRSDWEAWLAGTDPDDTTAARIRKVLALERVGAEVRLVQGDAADAAQMKRVVADVLDRFGQLDGVVSAAGLADASVFAPIAAMDRQHCEQQFRVKVRGMFALEEALNDRPLDFCFIVSSLSSQLGGLGYAGYAAANRFMDGFVRRHNNLGSTPWLGINWDAWRSDEQNDVAGSSLARLALTPLEGLSAFAHALTVPDLGQLIVSTADFDARLSEWTGAGLLRRSATLVDGPERQMYARPTDLDAVYEEPETDTERAIAEVWQDVLGIDRIGLQDNFLDLGGNSLSALQVIGRVQSRLGVSLAIEEFIFQTVRQLATICDERQASTPPTEAASPRRPWFRAVRNAIRASFKPADATQVR